MKRLQYRVGKEIGILILHNTIAGAITMAETFPIDYCKKVLDILLSPFSDTDADRDPETVLNGSLELLSHFLCLNRGRIFLWNEHTSQLDISYSYGLTKEQQSRGSYEISEGVTGEVMESGRAILVENLFSDSRVKRKISTQRPNALANCYIAIPLQYSGIKLGVFAVECANNEDGDIEANAIIARMMADEFAKLIYQNHLYDFGSFQVA